MPAGTKLLICADCGKQEWRRGNPKWCFSCARKHQRIYQQERQGKKHTPVSCPHCHRELPWNYKKLKDLI